MGRGDRADAPGGEGMWYTLSSGQDVSLHITESSYGNIPIGEAHHPISTTVWPCAEVRMTPTRRKALISEPLGS